MTTTSSVSLTVPTPHSSAAPARKVLLALTIAVLIGHWLALGGRLSIWPGQWFKAPTEMGALPTANPVDGDATLPNNTEPPPEAGPVAPVATSTVRWIAPPAPEPEPEPEPPPPAPAPAPTKPVEVIKPEALLPSEPVASPKVVETITESGRPMTEQELLSMLDIAPQPEAAAEAPATLAPSQIETPATTAEAATPRPADDASPRAPSQTTREVSLPPSATLNYDVKGKAKGFNYSAGGTLTWNQEGDRYEAKLEVSAFLLGTYVQTSSGQVTREGLAPERFADKRRSSEKAAHFEASTGRIRYSNNAPDAPLLPGAQDQLSITLQLAGLMNTYPNLSGARTVSMPVSSTGSSEIWQFEVGAITTLKLPAGEVRARLLTRAPRRENDKTVELWLAPDLAFLPVRIRLTEHNGDFLDLQLEDLPATPPGSRPQPVRETRS